MFSCFLSVHPFVHLSGYILLQRYLINSLNNPSKIYWEYLLAPTDDQVRFWRSRVKVTVGCQGGEGIHVDTGASKSIFFWLKSVHFDEVISKMKHNVVC